MARRKYGTVFMCDFDLSLYPFDNQHCYMHFRITSASSSFLAFDLAHSTVLNSANKLLVEYEVSIVLWWLLSIMSYCCCSACLVYVQLMNDNADGVIHKAFHHNVRIRYVVKPRIKHLTLLLDHEHTSGFTLSQEYRAANSLSLHFIQKKKRTHTQQQQQQTQHIFSLLK